MWPPSPGELRSLSIQFPRALGALREAVPHHPLSPASTVDHRALGPVSAPHPAPLPGSRTLPQPGIGTLWGGWSLPRDPRRGDRASPGSRCCGAGCPWVSPRTDGGHTRDLLPRRRGAHCWTLRGPRTLWPALAARGGGGRCLGQGALPAATSAALPPSRLLFCRWLRLASW